MKNILIVLLACVLIVGFAGCYKMEDIAQSGYANDLDNSSDPNDLSASDTPYSDITIPTALSTTTSTPTTQTTTPTTTTTAYAYDMQLASKCANFLFDYKIVKGVVEGTINTADLKKLKTEMPYYLEINATSSRCPDFEIQDARYIGDAAATQKARDYIKIFFDYSFAADVVPESIIRYNFTESTSNAYLKWNAYYSIIFKLENPSEGVAEIYYGVNIDAISGKCIGGNSGKSTIPFGMKTKPKTEAVIDNMQTRAKQFVTNKNLVPDSQCVYVFSDLTAFDDPECYQLETELYFDNGVIVNFHESFSEGYQIYFNIFQAHGFDAISFTHPNYATTTNYSERTTTGVAF